MHELTPIVIEVELAAENQDVLALTMEMAYLDVHSLQQIEQMWLAEIAVKIQRWEQHLELILKQEIRDLQRPDHLLLSMEEQMGPI